MASIIVAIIGLIGTICAAVIPKIMERHLVQSGADVPVTLYPFPVLVILAFLSVFGAWGALAYSGSSPLTSVIFFLVLAAVSAVMYANGCVREPQELGTYVGYCSALSAVLLGLWWLLGDWTYATNGGNIEVYKNDHPIHLWYAWAVSAFFYVSLKRVWASRRAATATHSRPTPPLKPGGPT